MKQGLNLIVILSILVFFVSCKDGRKKETQKIYKNEVENQIEHTSKKDCNNVHWSHHKGADGSENWKNLCDGFVNCGGNAQSPINIITKISETKDKLSAPKFNYGKSEVDIINNGHTVQFNILSANNKVTLDNKEYKLLQFHYHALSEHTVDGKHFPIEVHFVHQHSDTDFAVLGVMFKQGKKNKLFTKYLEYFPKAKGLYKSKDMIDLLSLFPSDKSYYNYKGSLTTPPCSEVVNWYVLKTPVTASKEQINQFSKILDNNFRPVQPLNKRTILSYNE